LEVGGIQYAGFLCLTFFFLKESKEPFKTGISQVFIFKKKEGFPQLHNIKTQPIHYPCELNLDGIWQRWDY